MSKLLGALPHMWHESPVAAGYYAVPDHDKGCEGCAFSADERRVVCSQHKCYGVVYVTKAEAMARRLTEAA